VARVNGITSTLVRQGGGRIPGQAALINLSGATLEEMTVLNPGALILNYPSLSSGGGFGRGGFRPGGPAEFSPTARAAAARELDRIKDLFRQAREYGAGRTAGTRTDTRLEAMQPYLRAERPVIINATTHAQIVGALKLIDELKVKGIIAGGSEAWKAVDELATKKVPVIVGEVLALPLNPYDPYDCMYANAGQLVRAGVRIAFQSNDSSNARNLPYQAAMAVAYGLPRDEALRALTSNAADLLGVGEKLGTLEAGKIANLVVTDGDLLEIRTEVRHLFIGGNRVSLETRHSRLADTYLKRTLEYSRQR
jgi:imidazolonepropionase-like amidohydrolase